MLKQESILPLHKYKGILKLYTFVINFCYDIMKTEDHTAMKK
jgi:hypothetical protein